MFPALCARALEIRAAHEDRGVEGDRGLKEGDGEVAVEERVRAGKEGRGLDAGFVDGGGARGHFGGLFGSM